MGVLLMVSMDGFAQEGDDQPSRITMPEFSLSYLQPTGVFKDQHPDNGYGIDAGIHFQLSVNHPFTIGVLSSYHFLNNRKVGFTEEIDGQFFNLTESATSQLVMVLGAVRYYPQLWDSSTKIYTDLLFGPKIFFTTIRLSDDNGGDSINDFSIEESDISLSYGIGVGLQFPFHDFIHLKTGIQYLPGVSASYYSPKKEPIDTDFAIELYDRKNSATNIWTFNFGLSFFL